MCFYHSSDFLLNNLDGRLVAKTVSSLYSMDVPTRSQIMNAFSKSSEREGRRAGRERDREERREKERKH